MLQAGGGSGLGLFISKGIVDAHNGQMSLFSEGLGRGSTFTVTIPWVDTYLDDDLKSHANIISLELPILIHRPQLAHQQHNDAVVHSGDFN